MQVARADADGAARASSTQAPPPAATSEPAGLVAAPPPGARQVAAPAAAAEPPPPQPTAAASPATGADAHSARYDDEGDGAATPVGRGNNNAHNGDNGATAAVMVVWRKPPAPGNEAARRAALCQYDILDTEPEEAYDRITALCRRLFRCPVALLTFIDKDRVWFKSAAGLGAEAPGALGRGSGLCAWTLLSRHPRALVVPDMLADRRYRDYPVVTGPPHARFYAGVPLVCPLSGHKLGTLCVVDRRPRTDFSAEAAGLLAQLGAMAMREVDRRRRTNAARCAAVGAAAAAAATGTGGPGGGEGAAPAVVPAAVASAAAADGETPLDRQGVMLLDAASPAGKWPVLLANDAWCRATGVPREMAAGAHFWDLFEPPEPAQRQAVALAAEQGRAFELRVLCNGGGRDGRHQWTRLRLRPAASPATDAALSPAGPRRYGAAMAVSVPASLAPRGFGRPLGEGEGGGEGGEGGEGGAGGEAAAAPAADPPRFYWAMVEPTDRELEAVVAETSPALLAEVEEEEEEAAESEGAGAVAGAWAAGGRGSGRRSNGGGGGGSPPAACSGPIPAPRLRAKALTSALPPGVPHGSNGSGCGGSSSNGGASSACWAVGAGEASAAAAAGPAAGEASLGDNSHTRCSFDLLGNPQQQPPSNGAGGGGVASGAADDDSLVGPGPLAAGGNDNGGGTGSGGSGGKAPAVAQPAAQQRRGGAGSGSGSGHGSGNGSGNSGARCLSLAAARPPAGAGPASTTFSLLPEDNPLHDITLGALLGWGSYGRVHRGWWNGSPVAIKVVTLPPQAPAANWGDGGGGGGGNGNGNGNGAAAGLGPRAALEPLLHHRLSHPGIVKLYDVMTQRADEEDEEEEDQQEEGGAAFGGSGGRAGGDAASSGSGVFGPGGGAGPPIEVWMVLEHCDRGTLSDAVARGELADMRPGAGGAGFGAGGGNGFGAGGVGAASSPCPFAYLPDALRVASTAREVAEAMAYLHAQCVLHGDLNGNNILLCSSGGGGGGDGRGGGGGGSAPSSFPDGRGFRAKVADFGLSRLAGDGAAPLRTATHGTATHMAPEVLSDNAHSRAADVWSFGVVLWELLAGERPFAGCSYAQVVLRVARAQQAAAAGGAAGGDKGGVGGATILPAPAGAPPALARIMERCLSPRPEDRPTFERLVLELAAVEAGAAADADSDADA